ncbi:alpha/beta hydrolase [Trebonia sp.]|uniref:alpha/beta hydrolase n=1 Tax=Trebonia sp. TaxID=2767075 RepID=UPI002611A33A|nr:alpha/beta hydrolase [Trebonia sp.]
MFRFSAARTTRTGNKSIAGLTAPLALVAALATGCTAGGAAAKPAATASATAGTPATPSAAAPSATAAPPTTLAQYYAQRLEWVPCDTYFKCARLLVPFDYARPAWRRFSLPVVELPAADPALRIGALVINPGGPGGSGVDYALGARSGEFTQAILDRFDIVGFDPRGVGGSEPAVHCMSGPQLDTYFATNDDPANAAQLAAVVAESRLYAAQCARNAAALLPYVGTVNAARDMDVLRAALGEPALTYLGKSYGTVLGASYAQQFPTRVRALVLDGAVNPALTGLQLDVAQAQGFESAFGQFAAWCVTQSGCPFGQASADHPAPVFAADVARVAGLLAAASQHPLTNLLGDGQPADGAMLLTGVAAALYLRAEWPLLVSALSEAFSGDGTVLVELANFLMERNPNGTYSNLSDAETAIDCVDRPWPRSLAAWRAAAAAAAKAAPLFGAAIVWGSLPCAYWPVKPSVLTARAAGARPILVVGDLHDPATPYQWAVGLARDLASGVLLGWNGEGHTSYMEGSTCVDDIVDAYLISLKTPRSGTVCP